jgi:hypothetical protein
MKTPIHRRALAAISLLVFAITAVVAGIFAISAATTPDKMAAPAMIVVASTIVAVAIVVASREADESVIDTFVNLMIISTLLVLATTAKCFAMMMPAYGHRAAFAGINDTGYGIDMAYRRRHSVMNDTKNVIPAYKDTGQLTLINSATSWTQALFDETFDSMMADPATYDPLATSQFIDVTAIDMIDGDLVTA